MKTLKISINLDNFSDGGTVEVARILRGLADRAEFGAGILHRNDIAAVNGLPVVDASGKRVGKVTVTGWNASSGNRQAGERNERSRRASR